MEHLKGIPALKVSFWHYSLRLDEKLNFGAALVTKKKVLNVLELFSSTLMLLKNKLECFTVTT